MALLVTFVLMAALQGVVFSKVVPTFYSEAAPTCDDYFYQNTEPEFTMQSSYQRICQMKSSIEPGKIFYATLYDTNHKIPVYSAYTLVIGASYDRPSWMVEPQLENKSYGDDMVFSYSVNDEYTFKTQASDEDYKGSGLTRGHCNPHSYHDGEERIATFTLTNIAPQYSEFNSGSWAAAEQEAKKIMAEHCFGNANQKLPYVKKFEDATAYFITGGVPDDKPSAVIGRNVTIPKISFTATCCSDPEREEEFSFGYYGFNVVDASAQHTRAVTLTELQDILNKAWGGDQNISFFEGGCNTQPEATQDHIGRMNKKLTKYFNKHG
eukprot:TCONS_00020058-protein